MSSCFLNTVLANSTLHCKNLLQTLHCFKIDQAEFEQVVASYFGHGHHANPHEICHARTTGGSALRVLYGKTGKLTKVLAGPDIQPGEIGELRTKIEAELLIDGASKVRRRVLWPASVGLNATNLCECLRASFPP
jgi:hypothetical protein